jgi:hypothetical protein
MSTDLVPMGGPGGNLPMVTPEMQRVLGNPNLTMYQKSREIRILRGELKPRGPKGTLSPEARKKARKEASKMKREERRKFEIQIGLRQPKVKLTKEQKVERRKFKSAAKRQMAAEWAKEHPQEAMNLGWNPKKMGKTPGVKKVKAPKMPKMKKGPKSKNGPVKTYKMK